MKKLHEMKISELIGMRNSTTIPLFDLKQWAIAVVKERRQKHKEIAKAMNDAIVKPIAGEDSNVEFQFHHYDDVCKFLIDKFELTEEDLK